MTLTLLLDLDGTLLDNDMGRFMPAYMQKLSGQMAPYVEPEQLVRKLLVATRYMMDNTRPDRTLKESFDQLFYPSLGLDETLVKETIEDFYQRIFPSLQDVTVFLPQAVKLVEDALARGYRVGIATNPLFPRMAIVHRIHWAGLDPNERHTLGVIPSYERFHFAKPNPAYFAEYLAQTGWPEGPVVMVGNDFEMDILPARKLGLPVFYTPDAGTAPPPTGEEAAPTGSLEDVLPWIDSQTPEALTPKYDTPSALLAVLQSTPAALRTLSFDLPDDIWTYCPKPGEWSLAEITCHLRDVEIEVNLDRLEKILSEPNPFIPGIDTDVWAKERQYNIQDCTDALNRFVSARIELLQMLERVPPDAWTRTARHAIFGPTTLREMVSIIAGHDRLHIRQVFDTLPQA